MRILVGLLVAVIFLCVHAAPGHADDWKAEFDALCSQVQAAEGKSTEELEDLIKRCDALMPVIKASDDPKKKVYIFRLKKCRKFFEYANQANR